MRVHVNQSTDAKTKKVSAPAQGEDSSLDIPLYRTSPALTRHVKTRLPEPPLVGTTVNGARLLCNSRYSPPAFHVLSRRPSWLRRIDSVGYNVLRATEYEVFTGTFCGIQLHSAGCSVQPLHYFDPLSVIVGAGKDVKARNFHVNPSHFRLWAAGFMTLTSSFVPVKITLVDLSNTGNSEHIDVYRFSEASFI